MRGLCHALGICSHSLNRMTTIIIPARFRGPPRSGNGGYVSGVVASVLTDNQHALADQQAAEVTLRAPIPLDQPMAAERVESRVVVRQGEKLIAEAQLATLQMDIPAAPTWDEALAVREQSPSLKVGLHPFFPEQGPRTGFHPICVCCGAELGPADGLHVYAAAIPHRSLVAAAWRCPEMFANAAGYVPPEIIWTALDCPGQFAWLAAGTRTGMLGRLTARVERDVRCDEQCVVTGWTIANEGRKYFAGTALFNAAGELCAYAKAVWIGRADA